MADFSAYIDQYCERLAPGLLAEPLNLYSNASFLIFSVAAFYEIQMSSLTTKQKRAWDIVAGLAFVVGIGSALFHSFATFWAQLADIIPIGILLLTFIGIYCSVSLKLGPLKSAFALVSFLAITALLGALFPKDLVNGSQQYFGTVVALIIMAWDSRRRHIHRSQKYFWLATISFIVSLTFRTLDMTFCSAWPLGTHFLWHSFNGLTIYFAIMAGVSAIGSTSKSKSNQPT